MRWLVGWGIKKRNRWLLLWLGWVAVWRTGLGIGVFSCRERFALVRGGLTACSLLGIRKVFLLRYWVLSQIGSLRYG